VRSWEEQVCLSDLQCLRSACRRVIYPLRCLLLGWLLLLLLLLFLWLLLSLLLLLFLGVHRPVWLPRLSLRLHRFLIESPSFALRPRGLPSPMWHRT
jgi:hypothetical protein